MIPCQFSLYLGRESEKGYADFIAEDIFYCIVEIEEGFTKEQGKALAADLKERSKKSLENLYAFELLITDAIKHHNLPANFSLAAIYRKEDMIYLKTAGAGQIFLNREGEFARIIEKDNSASGHVKKSDFFILTTSRFTQLVGSEKQFKNIFTADNLEKNVEELTTRLENQESEGTVALFLLFTEREQAAQVATPTAVVQKAESPPAPQVKSPSFFSGIKNQIQLLQNRAKDSPLRRIFTIIFLIIIVGILIWSVILGVQRRNESELIKKIQASQEIIDHKLSQADDVAGLNSQSAVILITQARDELTQLKKAIGNRTFKEVSDLESKIKAEEQKVTKKEEKSYAEFFDLTVDDKNARGDKIFLDGDDALILDKKRGVVYVLSLSQKSLDSRTASGIKQATLVGKNNDLIYVYIPQSGVHSIDVDSKTKKVIDVDSDWGTIQALNMYGGNMYLLDSGKSDIYKYPTTDSGFGTKVSYLRGQSVDFKQSNSMAIDSSVYVGFSDGILKFTSGATDTFKTSFPEEGVNIVKVFTAEDLDNVYAWDKNKSVLYVLDKNGTYERQIKSDIFSKANDFVVSGDNAYVLTGSKIYTISVK